jgi:DNA-binding response OmpR family regulator
MTHHILIVEDSAPIRGLIETEFQEIGWTTQAVRLPSLIDNSFNDDIEVAVVDVLFEVGPGKPTQSGLDAVRKLTQIAPAVPVVVFTEHPNGEAETIRLMREFPSVLGLVAKDDLRELPAAVNAVLDGKAFESRHFVWQASITPTTVYLDLFKKEQWRAIVSAAITGASTRKDLIEVSGVTKHVFDHNITQIVDFLRNAGELSQESGNAEDLIFTARSRALGLVGRSERNGAPTAVLIAWVNRNRDRLG